MYQARRTFFLHLDCPFTLSPRMLSKPVGSLFWLAENSVGLYQRAIRFTPECNMQVMPEFAIMPGVQQQSAGSMSAPVLVHYHIYKNAGSSMDALLQQSFGERWAAFEGTRADRVPINYEQLRTFLAENPDKRAVSSHCARPPLPTPRTRPIIMLRHPIDRARSVYHFARRDPTQPDHAVASASSFREYVEWFLPRCDAGVVIRNYQVIHLSDASFRYSNIELAQANVEDLAQAKSLLNDFGVFGLVRQFSESCRLFAAHYKHEFPELHLREVRENVSTNPAMSEDVALASARAELGTSAFAKLLRHNLLDLELYMFAKQHFARLNRAQLR
jgi:hypothetical protein